MAGGTIITGSGTRTNVAWSSDKGESRLSGVSADQAQRAFETAANKLAGNPASKLRVYNRNSPDRELVLKRKWIFGGDRRDDTAQVVRQLAEKASEGLSRGARNQFMQSVDRVLYSGEGAQRRAVNLKGNALRSLVNELHDLKAGDGQRHESGGVGGALEIRATSSPLIKGSGEPVSQQQNDPQIESTTSELLRQSDHGNSANALFSRIPLRTEAQEEMQDAVDTYTEPRGSQSNRQTDIRPGSRLSEISQRTFSGVPEQEEGDGRIVGGGLQQWEKSHILETRLQKLEEGLNRFDLQFETQPFDLTVIHHAAEALSDRHQALTEEIEAADTDIDTAIEKFEQLGVVSEQLAELQLELDQVTTWLDESNQIREEKLNELNHEAHELHAQYAPPDVEVVQFNEPLPVLVDIKEQLAAIKEMLQLREPDLNSVRLREAQSIQTVLAEAGNSLRSFKTRADTLINATYQHLPPSARLQRTLLPSSDPIQAPETPALNNALDAARSRSGELNEFIEGWESKKNFVQTRQLSDDGALLSAIDGHLLNLRAEKDKIDSFLGSVRTVAQPTRVVSEPESAPVAKPESPAPRSKASVSERALRDLISLQINVSTSSTIEDARRRFDRAVNEIDQILNLATRDDIEANAEIRALLLRRFDAPDWWVASFNRATSDLTRLYDNRINALESPEAILAQRASAEERQRVDAEVLQLTGELEKLAKQREENAALNSVTNGFIKAHLDATEAQAQLNTFDSDQADATSLATAEKLETLKRILATAREKREELGKALLSANTDDQNLFSVELEDELRTADDLEFDRDYALAVLDERREAIIQNLESKVEATEERIQREAEETDARLTAARQRQANLATTSATGMGEELVRLQRLRAEAVATAERIRAELDAYQTPSSSR